MLKDVVAAWIPSSKPDEVSCPDNNNGDQAQDENEGPVQSGARVARGYIKIVLPEFRVRVIVDGRLLRAKRQLVRSQRWASAKMVDVNGIHRRQRRCAHRNIGRERNACEVWAAMEDDVSGRVHVFERVLHRLETGDNLSLEDGLEIERNEGNKHQYSIDRCLQERQEGWLLLRATVGDCKLIHSKYDSTSIESRDLC
jgi:hypothetical protein